MLSRVPTWLRYGCSRNTQGSRPPGASSRQRGMPIADVMRARERSELGNHHIHGRKLHLQRTAQHMFQLTATTCITLGLYNAARAFTTILDRHSIQQSATLIDRQHSASSLNGSLRSCLRRQQTSSSRLCNRLWIPCDDVHPIPAFWTSIMHIIYALTMLAWPAARRLATSSKTSIAAKHIATEYGFTGLETRGRN